MIMSTANIGFEEKLWGMADKLRGSMDASEYKHVVLGLLFLKYVSDSFEELHATLSEEEWADPEDKEEYLLVIVDKLRVSMVSYYYQYVVLVLLFLKYVSDSFEELHATLYEEEWADPEDKDEYLAEKIFWVPKKARWTYIKENAKKPEINKISDDAIIAIEKENE